MIVTTYGQMRQAYGALLALTREGVQIKLTAALRWKRILGVLRPLVEQMEEQQRETLDKFTERDADGKPVTGEQPGTVRVTDMAAFTAAIQEIVSTPLQVGCDLVLAGDFGDGDAMVSAGLTQQLVDLGPFFDMGATHE